MKAIEGEAYRFADYVDRRSGNDVAIQVDASENPRAPWFVDFEYRDHKVVVEGRPGEGYGITSNVEIPYGAGADEVLRDEGAAVARVVELLFTRGRTKPSGALAVLRSARGLSQAELASALAVKQAAVAQREAVADPHVSTVAEAVRAMGGRLEIRAVFPGDTKARVLHFPGVTDAPAENEPEN